MANKPTRRASPRVAASAYAKVAPPTPEPVTPPAPRRPAGGFWLGLVLVVLALLMLLGKTVVDFISVPNLPAEKTLHTDAFVQAQTYWRTWESEETAYAAALPLYRHNPDLGNADGPTVVMFADLGCVPCRATLRLWHTLGQDFGHRAHFVIKLWPNPARSEATEAAIFAQIAHDHNLFWPFYEAVMTTTQDSAAYYLEVLAQLGVPLRQVRHDLLTHQEDYLRALGQDTVLAQSLRLVPPTAMFIQGHRLGAPGLPSTAVQAILTRAINGDPLIGLE